MIRRTLAVLIGLGLVTFSMGADCDLNPDCEVFCSNAAASDAPPAA